MEGDSIAEISRKLEVSRGTVYKYLAMEDLSQRPPAPCAKASVLDRYRPRRYVFGGVAPAPASAGLEPAEGVTR